jgi:hypothetical protein
MSFDQKRGEPISLMFDMKVLQTITGPKIETKCIQFRVREGIRELGSHQTSRLSFAGHNCWKNARNEEIKFRTVINFRPKLQEFLWFPLGFRMVFVKPEVSVTQNHTQDSGPEFRLLILD